MYLRYNNLGLAGKAYDIPVPEPYLEITDKQNEMICNGEKWFVNNGELTQTPTEAYLKNERKIEVEAKINELNELALEYTVNQDEKALKIVQDIKEGLLNSI